MSRPTKDEYFLRIARDVALRSTCLRRQYGAVIVSGDVIVSTGYNGAARGEPNCCDVGECWREAHNIPHGEQYEKCRAVHAEENALLNGNREDMVGATLYLAGWENGEPIEAPEPCEMCKRKIANARIGRVVTKYIPQDFFDKQRELLCFCESQEGCDGCPINPISEITGCPTDDPELLEEQYQAMKAYLEVMKDDGQGTR